jgi:hypothetical protein
VEQPVGLMLDKSQGLAVGAELVTNGDFASSSGWTLPGTGTNSITGGQAVLSGASGYLLRTGTSITAGVWYRVQFTVSGYSGSGTVRPYIQASPVFGSTVTGNGNFTQYLLATATNANTEIGLNFASSFTGNIDDISIKSLAGNHALQATSASRPVLRARYNQLTYSEQFDNAAWSKVSLGVTANTSSAPNNTTTADKITPNGGGVTPYLFQTYTTTATPYCVSFYAKADGYNFVQISDSVSATDYCNFNLSTGAVGNSVGYTGSIQNAGNGWYRCIVTRTFTAASTELRIEPLSTDAASRRPSFVADGTSGILLWGADLRTGSSAGTYQRIAAATDYDTVGFLPYLALDGTDDSMATGSISFTATDKMTVVAGITKLTSADGIISELSADLSTNNGAFYLFSYSDTAYYFGSKGTIQVQVASSALAAPRTNTLTGLGDISGDLVTLLVNGAQVAQNTSNQGTGNYGNYPLYIGRRGGSTLPFNGRIYQMIVCGKTLSASELASTEAYVNTKTGAY